MRPTPASIGERRWPDAQGRPGYLRVDTVRQGDAMGGGGAVQQISEAWLILVPEAMMKQFSFVIRGVHSNNGSGYINRAVARLLNKLLVGQAKSRPS